jgi:hypothetical protein
MWRHVGSFEKGSTSTTLVYYAGFTLQAMMSYTDMHNANKHDYYYYYDYYIRHLTHQNCKHTHEFNI